MSDDIRLSVTTVNAPDALALATFYAELTGGVTKGSEHWATVSGPNGFIAFQQVDDFRPPVWPGADVPMQMHLDFFVDDLEATGARAVVAGATLLDFQPNSDHCFVYADPAGHPFCLSTWDGPHLDDEPGLLAEHTDLGDVLGGRGRDGSRRVARRRRVTGLLNHRPPTVVRAQNPLSTRDSEIGATSLRTTARHRTPRSAPPRRTPASPPDASS